MATEKSISAFRLDSLFDAPGITALASYGDDLLAGVFLVDSSLRGGRCVLLFRLITLPLLVHLRLRDSLRRYGSRWVACGLKTRPKARKSRRFRRRANRRCSKGPKVGFSHTPPSVRNRGGETASDCPVASDAAQFGFGRSERLPLAKFRSQGPSTWYEQELLLCLGRCLWTALHSSQEEVRK